MNPETALTLDEGVAEVLALLTGLDLQYEPEQDRYNIIARMLNRALRSNALEKEWSYYSDHASIGPAIYGLDQMILPSSMRPRIINDDAVLLVNCDDQPVVWAYFVPRDALHKYVGRRGLRCSVTRQVVTFSRCFTQWEDGLDIQIPVMREPVMFRLPQQPEDHDDAPVTVPLPVRQQLIDFQYPDLITLRAAMYYAMTDPVMQPRVQTLDAQYKDLMYQIIERDDRNTDTPQMTNFVVPVTNGLDGSHNIRWGPLSDERG